MSRPDATPFETLRYEVDGGLARLTLDRPDSTGAMTDLVVREARRALQLAADGFREAVGAELDRLLATSRTALRGLDEHDVRAERMGFADSVQVESERHLRIAASERTTEAFRAFVGERRPVCS